MSAVIKSKSGNNPYLYESESYRDTDGKVRNKRRIIGKVDSVTGQYIYKPEYIEEKSLHTRRMQPMKPLAKPIFIRSMTSGSQL